MSNELFLPRKLKGAGSWPTDVAAFVAANPWRAVGLASSRGGRATWPLRPSCWVAPVLVLDTKRLWRLAISPI